MSVELLRLPDAQSQLKMADACDKQGWSSKVLRDKVSRELGGAKPDGKEAVQQDTILDCHFLAKGKVVIVHPRPFKRGAESFNDYATSIEAGLTQFVMGLDSEPKEVPAAA